MISRAPSRRVLRVQLLADRAFAATARFLHVEAVSGVFLLLAAAIALIWANSPAADSYQAFWHAPITLGIGPLVTSQSLHFWINDGVMAVFFLVVGVEIRREIHEGALSNLRLAALPLAAAAGGVLVPAGIYVLLNNDPIALAGWAVPTATDIAFAVGVLALLGKRLPGSVRVFLLALAIIDDIAAVLIIALFYSGGLQLAGLVVVAGGLALLGLWRVIGIGSAWAYVIPGAVLWGGLLWTGIHPTLAGVALGLMTPVVAATRRGAPLALARDAVQEIDARMAASEPITAALADLRHAQRELIAPVVRLQSTLHPWVAYGAMPLFALANAGVDLRGIDLSGGATLSVTAGIAIALVLGKPIGVIGASWLAVRTGLCQLPPGMNWAAVLLVGLLAGIGFTMSIFIASLAFADAALLGAAKLGVLMASGVAATVGLAWGAWLTRRQAAQ